YFCHCQPGDTILAMSLAHGGHLTHGSPVSFSGRLYNFVAYGLDKQTEKIDLDQVRDLARQHRPRLIVAGASAYPRLIDFEAFGQIAAEVEAALMADMAHIAGLVAAGLHPSPVPHSQFVTSTTHKTLRGPRGGFVLARTELGQQLDKQVFPGLQGGPLVHVIAAKATAFKEAQSGEFIDYSKQVVKNAAVLSQELTGAGLRLVSGGTDNHLLLVDVTDLGLTGQEAEDSLGRAGITVNKNAIPFDPRPPNVTSGFRLGSPAVTSRGFKEAEMALVGRMIAEVLRNPASQSVRSKVRKKVLDLCRSFPIYLDLLEG
ncbi:MAG: serine hydroxymethyltransferase, partial [Deltaproteobacteria bacterium]|nr:serine hydroxymethyltransferase [Deltaproteobacteria bacterium]